ncbi:hypothetical protein ElyMa_003374400 [Elysia marginata]|uniref:Secreted protein n=1 Tax=Elysia marginata TaxID=1093978 RepID=A0AAV4JMU3_9GAST|nr:hypothetical protein ElyMa_003374400 [Elysia marginata]
MLGVARASVAWQEPPWRGKSLRGVARASVAWQEPPWRSKSLRGVARASVAWRVLSQCRLGRVSQNREGLKTNIKCSDALAECTYELEIQDVTDKESYCDALKKTQTCLKTTQKDVGCKAKDSQEYLKKAILQKGAKYATRCDGVMHSVTLSLVVVSTLAVSWLRWCSH